MPGSHRWIDERPTADTPTVDVEMPAGSALIYLGSVWHGGGANHTDRARIGVVLHYAAGWLRPVENHVLAVAPEVVRDAVAAVAGAARVQHRSRRSSGTSTAAIRAGCSTPEPAS